MKYIVVTTTTTTTTTTTDLAGAGAWMDAHRDARYAATCYPHISGYQWIAYTADSTLIAVPDYVHSGWVMVGGDTVRTAADSDVIHMLWDQFYSNISYADIVRIYGGLSAHEDLVGLAILGTIHRGWADIVGDTWVYLGQ